MRNLSEALERGWPVYLDLNKHAITAIGKLGNKFIIFDPGDGKTSILTKNQLVRKWTYGKEYMDKFEGYIIKPKEPENK